MLINKEQFNTDDMPADVLAAIQKINDFTAKLEEPGQFDAALLKTLAEFGTGPDLPDSATGQNKDDDTQQILQCLETAEISNEKLIAAVTAETTYSNRLLAAVQTLQQYGHLTEANLALAIKQAEHGYRIKDVFEYLASKELLDASLAEGILQQADKSCDIELSAKTLAAIGQLNANTLILSIANAEHAYVLTNTIRTLQENNLLNHQRCFEMLRRVKHNNGLDSAVEFLAQKNKLDEASFDNIIQFADRGGCLVTLLDCLKLEDELGLLRENNLQTLLGSSASHLSHYASVLQKQYQQQANAAQTPVTSAGARSAVTTTTQTQFSSAVNAKPSAPHFVSQAAKAKTDSQQLYRSRLCQRIIERLEQRDFAGACDLLQDNCKVRLAFNADDKAAFDSAINRAWKNVDLPKIQRDPYPEMYAGSVADARRIQSIRRDFGDDEKQFKDRLAAYERGDKVEAFYHRDTSWDSYFISGSYT